MKRDRVLLFAVLTLAMFAGSALLAPRGAQAEQIKPEKTKIKLGLPVMTYTFLPIYLAEEKGLFEKEGLSVELVTFRGGSDLIKALVGGSVDLCLTSLAASSLAIRAGQPIKVIYGGYNMTAFDWWAVEKYKSLDNIKGARFGVSRFGTSTDFLTRYGLLSKGIDPEKDVKLIQGGGSATRLAAMEAGQLDVNIFAAPEKFIAADKGYKLILRQKDFMPDYPYHTFSANEEFIKNHPNTIKALLRGNIRGIRLAKEDRALAEQTLIKRIGMDEKYAARTYDDFMSDLFEDGHLPSDKGMDIFFEMGVRSGTYKEKWPKEKYLDPTFIRSYSEWKP